MLFLFHFRSVNVRKRIRAGTVMEETLQKESFVIQTEETSDRNATHDD